MSRRALFFPWPVGAGHTGRSLVVADLLRRAGHTPIFAIDPTGGMVAEARIAVAGSAAQHPRPRLPGRDYLAITGLDNAYASLGYYHPQRIREQVDQDRAIIRAASPDVVITHMQPTSVLAARLEGVPVVSIADADFFVTGDYGWMPWLAEQRPRLSPFPRSLPAFRQVSEEYGIPPPDEVSDLLLGEVVLIASIAELERPADRYAGDPRIHFVGPLLWEPDTSNALRDRIAAFGRAGRPRVYASGGGGAVAGAALLTTAADAAARGGWSLLLSTGLVDTPPVEDQPDVLRYRFGALSTASAWADVVVCHGGHSTVMAGLCAGKPVVVLPSMSENEANGRLIVERAGAGICLVRSDVGPDGRLRTRRSAPSAESHLPPDGGSLAAAVTEVLTVPDYRKNAQQIGRRLAAAQADAPNRILSLLSDTVL